jgi:NAD+ synthase (glutamine-hydrolysing)
MEKFNPSTDYLRAATACPEVQVGDVSTNIATITNLYRQACDNNAALVVFPELSVTGYSLGDLVQQPALLKRAQEGLLDLAAETTDTEAAMVVGLPLVVNNGLYNCAAVLSKGQIRGLVPKTNLPTYKEFYEKRWFQTWEPTENTSVMIGDQSVPFGRQQLFEVAGAKVGVEICEDLWVMDPPSTQLAKAGATIIVNPSASPELVGKSDYRRQLVGQQSARLLLGYLYAGCDATESTMDIVMSGHQLIAEDGSTLAERQPLAIQDRLQMADIDITHLVNERLRDTNTPNHLMDTINCEIKAQQTDLQRYIDPRPFLPKGEQAGEQLDTILNIQATGLERRLRERSIKNVVLGLSGGLDSTLALLVACRAARRMGLEPGELIQTITMPGEASSEQTQSNAVTLANMLNIPNEEIPIGELAKQQMAALGHDGLTQDVTYENIQARLRTSILFNRVNQVGGLVLGTGDLSEIALGWCTFNGDHMSHYNVNASIPKTLVRELVEHEMRQPDLRDAYMVLEDILDTPVSPELVKAEGNAISQKTEEIIGPYELHDFFLYHFIRWNDEPTKIQYLAEQAFGDDYVTEEIEHWLGVFMQRFFGNQWKRSVAPDGPKVGSVSLSPRGDWRMPSDMIISNVWQ